MFFHIKTWIAIKEVRIPASTAITKLPLKYAITPATPMPVIDGISILFEDVMIPLAIKILSDV